MTGVEPGPVAEMSARQGVNRVTYLGVLGVIAGATAAVYSSLTASQTHTVRGENDLPGTLNEAAWMRLSPPRLPSPHFLLPTAIRVLDWIVSPRVAICVALVLASVWLYRSYGRWFVTGQSWETTGNAAPLGFIALDVAIRSRPGCCS